MLHLRGPTKLYLDETVPLEEARTSLTYVDTSVDFELRKFTKNQWMKNKLSPGEWTLKLNSLKAARDKCLLLQDAEGYYTHSGLQGYMEETFQQQTCSYVTYPEPKRIPWYEVPPSAREYQVTAKELLLQVRHGAVNIGTGLGKSYILLHICKELGLKAVVMAPLTSIAEQLYDDFSRFLGTKYVGFYGGGKKDTNKLVTIAIGASLAKIAPGSSDYASLSKAKVFVADESHQTPAATLSAVCLGMLKDAPYRFFFSGTQTRGDGADLLLKGIIGPIVYTKSVREGVDEGYLSKPEFYVYRTRSSSTYYSKDPNRMTQEHLYNNPQVNALVAKITDGLVTRLGHSVLILIDEMEQFGHLAPFLSKYRLGFAHGGVTSTNKKYVPEAYHKSDPKELVRAFNARELDVLVGTSCIATGTDIRACKSVIYLRGGKSEIELAQSIGRGTRLFQHGDYKKNSFYFIDFMVENIDVLKRHAETRIDLCNAIYGPVKVL